MSDDADSSTKKVVIVSPPGEWLNLPNKITLARLFIAALLFVLFSIEIHWGLGDRSVVLNCAVAVFIVCVATDWLDGWLARRWGMTTTFGRLADPFVDKVVVCGSFIYLVELAPTVVKPWFAVVLIAREFLVTSLRSHLESQGVPFGARRGGKIKMIVQSVAVPVILFYQANFGHAGDEDGWASFFYGSSVALVTATLIATLISAWDYISLALSTLSSRAGQPR